MSMTKTMTTEATSSSASTTGADVPGSLSSAPRTERSAAVVADEDVLAAPGSSAWCSRVATATTPTSSTTTTPAIPDVCVTFGASRRRGLCTVKMARLALFFSALTMVCVARSIAWDDLQALQTRSAAVYCGTNLSDVLSLVCKGRYNTPPSYHDRRKRDLALLKLDNASAVLQDTGATSLRDLRTLRSRRKSRHVLREQLKARRRFRRGVYNECCQKACSYAVLRTYCAD